MKSFFQFFKHNTDYKKETLAGITTFLTMAYIIVVNPAILETAGIPKGPSMTATILAAALGSLLMGVFANRPVAVAPYMGENAFIAFTVVAQLGTPWPVALGSIFLAGVLFTLLTVFRVRGWLAQTLPESLKYSFAVGIGLFLIFIGLNESGIVTLGVPGAPVALGNMTRPPALLALFGFFLITWLLINRVRGAILIGVLGTALLSFLFGITPLPSSLVSLPPSLGPIFLKLDIASALSPKHLPVALIIFIMAFVDTVGTLIGLSARSGFLDERGNLPEIEKPMLADAVANMIAPVLGTTTTGAYIESAAGIEEGGRTGFVPVVTAVLFLAALFFAPVLTIVPAHAYGPALIVIGMFMIGVVTRIDFGDYTELVPSLLTIALMVFTYNIGVGMTAGLISYPFLKVLTGRAREINPGMWIFAVLSLVFYAYYPYR